MKRFVILGAGVAGKRAAERIRARDGEARIVVVEEQPDAFYYKPMLGEYVAGRVPEGRIGSGRRGPFAALGAQVMTGRRAVGLDTDAQEVVLENGERLGFDGLLIASGTRACLPEGVPPGQPGVLTLDSLAQARAMASRVGSVRRAVVQGVSLAALGAIKGLRQRGVACTLLLPEERFWPGVLDGTASEIVQERLRREGVVLARKALVAGVAVKDGRLKGVVTAGGGELEADLLVVAGARVPSTEWLTGTGLASGGGVPVNGALRTRHENVYAAGDVALHPSAGAEGGAAAHAGWLSAWEQGAVAGHNMAGGGAAYHGVPSVRAMALDLDLVCLGVSDPAPGAAREETGGYPFEELPYIYKKIVYQGGKVAGALFVGDATEAGRVGQWVRKGIPEEQADPAVLNQMFQARIGAVSFVGALCPVCKHQIQLDGSCQEGDVVTCPACGVDFRLERMPNGVFRARFVS